VQAVVAVLFVQAAAFIRQQGIHIDEAFSPLL